MHIFYKLITGMSAKILFSLFSQNENWAKLSVHLKLQVYNPWTKLADIWPACCQIVTLTKKVWNQILISLLTFLSDSIFSAGISNGSLSLTSYLSKTEVRFFNQKCQEASVIVIGLFHLFLAGLVFNLQRHLLLEKACHFWNAFVFWTFKRN